MKYRIKHDPFYDFPFLVESSRLGVFWSTVDLFNSLASAKDAIRRYEERDRSIAEFNSRRGGVK